ncbi:ABC transporter substrate-binding protein [Metabacillus niabensis]|uniref:ABC transporter substrate-binding protein n=1 Tax=Metabacillus niabensis TaxID=324854 RepID=UPI001CFB90F4|nr:extracellular solute-binding protein [Metabacillus niabensis]
MRSRKLKQISKISLAMLLLLLVLAACSGGKEAGTVESSNGEVVIKYWSASDTFNGESSPGMQAVKEFNEKYKGEIRVDAKYSPWEEHNPSMQAALASEGVPDLFQMPLGAKVGTLVEDELIQPISELVSDEWSSKFYEGTFVEGVNQFDGKIYAWPESGDSMSYMLYYNKDVLEKAGLDSNKPPKTWDELKEMAKKVTEQGKGDTFGLTFAGGGPAVFVENAISGFALGINPEHTNDGFNLKTGQYEVNGENWVNSVSYLLDLKKNGYILPSSMMLKVPEAQMLFGEGKAAFLLDGRWGMWQIKKNTPEANFGVTHSPTPDGSIPSYGYNIALHERENVISKDTKHPEAVAKFIEEGLTSKLFYEKYLQSGVSLTPLPEVNEDTSSYPYPVFHDFVQVHEETLKSIPDPFARNTEQDAVSDAIGGIGQSKMKPSFSEVMVMLMNETGDVEELLNETNEKLNQNLEEAVKKVKEEGANVSLEDYKFPNWDPQAEYLQEDYEELNK